MVNRAADNFRRVMGAQPIKLKRRKDEKDEDNLIRKASPRNLIKSPEQSLNSDEREELGRMLDSFPKLRAAHKAKEEFAQIYNLSSRKQADERFREWELDLPEVIKPQFADVLSILRNWREEILNYFNHKITNAFTESMNNMVRRTDHPGRGYDFDVLRAKVLYTYGRKREKVKIFNRKAAAFDPNIDTFSRMIDYEPQSAQQVYEEVDYGVPIATFFEKWEEGDF